MSQSRSQRVASSAAGADLRNVQAVVPVRGLGDGKERLGFALDAEEREALILGMLLETLEVTRSSLRLSGVVLVTDDERVREVARERGASIVAEPQPAGLNRSLLAGRAAALEAGATAVLFLPADLPLLTSVSLETLLDAADAALAAGRGQSLAVICPADVGDGTNALLLSPPDAIEPAFGPASLEAHLRLAAAAQATVQLVADPALGFDLDTPEDLERLDARRTLELLHIGTDALAAAEPA